MSLFSRIFCGLLFLFFLLPLQAETHLKIVTDPWPPYAVNNQGKVEGMDVETIKAVFKRMNISVSIEFCPWKRCLLMIEKLEADAILDASVTAERKHFMHFPEEPVSIGKTVFFLRKGYPIKSDTLQDLDHVKTGAVLGYSYCKELDDRPFIKNAHRAKTLKPLFNMLIAERIDMVVEVDAVGFSTAQEMGISKQIEIIPESAYCIGGNHLAFAKKEGLKEISEAFSEALKQFKTTSEYQKILSKSKLAP